MVVWLTGLPCSGKTTIAQSILRHCEQAEVPCEVLDGDIIREGLCRDLGYSKWDRQENVHRCAHVARILDKHKILVVVALVSPYREHRQLARATIGPSFCEVFVECSISTCKERDAKGMYLKAAKGELKGFTGITDPYEIPEKPELVVNTETESVEEIRNRILKRVKG
jgi:adenylylsulfate kinase